MRRWCRAAATSRDTRLRSSWHEPSWHVFPFGPRPLPSLPSAPFHPATLSLRNPTLSVVFPPSLLLLLRLRLRYAHADIYIYIYNSSGTDVAVPNSFSTARGILFGTDEDIREARRGRLCSTCGSAFLDNRCSDRSL